MVVTFPRDGAGAAISHGLFARNLKTVLVAGVNADAAMTVAGIDPAVDQIVSVTEERSAVRQYVATGAAKATGITVTGIAVDDVILSAWAFTATNFATGLVNVADLYISAADTVQSNATSTSGLLVLITYNDVSEAHVDRTTEFYISGKNAVKRAAANSFTISAAAYDDTGGAAERLITLSNAFTNYTFSPGDTFTYTAGTGGTPVTTPIRIASKVDASNITLISDLSTGNSDVSGLAGIITAPGSLGKKYRITYLDRSLAG